jgi:hypothetical protein
MSLSRSEYLRDLLEDCYAATAAAEIPHEHEGHVVAAMILSDSYNGLRKALLQVQALRTQPPFVMGGDR